MRTSRSGMNSPLNQATRSFVRTDMETSIERLPIQHNRRTRARHAAPPRCSLDSTLRPVGKDHRTAHRNAVFAMPNSRSHTLVSEWALAGQGRTGVPVRSRPPSRTRPAVVDTTEQHAKDATLTSGGYQTHINVVQSRVREQFGAGPGKRYPPALEYDAAVGEAERVLYTLLIEQNRHTVPVDGADHLRDLRHHLRREAEERLVQHDKTRGAPQRPCNSHLLLLT